MEAGRGLCRRTEVLRHSFSKPLIKAKSHQIDSEPRRVRPQVALLQTDMLFSRIGRVGQAFPSSQLKV